jgi:SAM-dependent methyltransferase
MEQPDSHPPICDYEGSNYRTEFWEGRGRDYEDRVERIALRRLLPRRGSRLLEIGAGFGRLTREYDAFDQVVLLDYSFSQLKHAQEQLGRVPRYIYVAADIYALPFQPAVFDAATMIRVIHHMQDVPLALSKIRQGLGQGGVLILEHANKRNLKALIRHALKKQTWNPNTLDPVEFVELNFDFHPEYIRRELIKARFGVQRRLPVSYFRLGALKERIPVSVLTAADAALQYSGLLYAPSIFVRALAERGAADQAVPPAGVNEHTLFACPQCGGALERRINTMVCTRDGTRYAIRDGIYDFKAPLENS